MQAIPDSRNGLGVPCLATVMPVGMTVTTNTHRGRRNISPIWDGGYPSTLRMNKIIWIRIPT